MTAYLWHPASLQHDTGGHVEQIARAERLSPANMKPLVPDAQFVDPFEYDALKWIQRVHTREYIDFVRHTCEKGRGLLDHGDTVVSADSFHAALEAVNAVLTAADLVASGQLSSAFCAIRPPGHHALPDRAMGFCIFANVAILARYLQQQHGHKKIAVVDWDVHHGNGTQDIFYEDPSVLFISLHQFPLWPGTGRESERGRGAGDGFTLNIPISPGTSEADYLATFEAKVIPAIDSFAPDFLIISAGFDAHRDDPLGGLRLTESAFAHMTHRLCEAAARECRGRVISCLEGGYNLTALQNSVAAHVRELLKFSKPVSNAP